MADLLTKRYGQPMSSHNFGAMNAMGAKFSNVRLVWEGENVKIVLDERQGTIDASRVQVIQKATYRAWLKEAEKETADTYKKL